LYLGSDAPTNDDGSKAADEEHGSGAAHLISYRGDESANAESANESFPCIMPPALEEIAFGERMLGEATLGAASIDARCWGGPETILLVEDEGFVRKVTAEVLESAGYKVVIARSGAEALEACHRLSKPVDLLLADIVMPGMSGRDLATEFESLCPLARVLLMSGYAGQLARCQVSSYGKTYLAKPFSAQMLLKRVREILDSDPFDGGALA
jgi:CheY-like chemotaxis protein